MIRLVILYYFTIHKCIVFETFIRINLCKEKIFHCLSYIIQLYLLSVPVII